MWLIRVFHFLWVTGSIFFLVSFSGLDLCSKVVIISIYSKVEN